MMERTAAIARGQIEKGHKILTEIIYKSIIQAHPKILLNKFPERSFHLKMSRKENEYIGVFLCFDYPPLLLLLRSAAFLYLNRKFYINYRQFVLIMYVKYVRFFLEHLTRSNCFKFGNGTAGRAVFWQRNFREEIRRLRSTYTKAKSKTKTV